LATSLKSCVHSDFLLISNRSIDSGGNEGEPRSHRQPYLGAVLSIVVALIVSFYTFWNLQFGSQYWSWGWWMLLAAVSFLLIAYGAYLFSNGGQSSPNTARESQLALIHARSWLRNGDALNAFLGRVLSRRYSGVVVMYFSSAPLSFGSGILV